MASYHERFEVINLSQEIYEGMPVYGMHQKTFIMVHMTHEQNKIETGADIGFSARNILMSEHGPTHSDAVWEYDPKGATIEKMPLEYFWGDAICLDVSQIRHPDHIEIKDLTGALERHGLDIRPGDIILLYTGHYDRTYPTKEWSGPFTGLSYASAEWLAKQGVVNIGIDQQAIDLTPDDLDFPGHVVCRDYKITNTENLCNLDKVAGKRFLYLGLPLNIRDGSGSPVRAVAFIEKEAG
ncbi:MAG: cyclase family protein [Deltaproteobacteria bacterium]|nr:cyclase family protein [Deltaproteobacteria bacterium]